MDKQTVQDQYGDLAREIHLENMEIQELENEIIEKREALQQKEKELAKLDLIKMQEQYFKSIIASEELEAKFLADIKAEKEEVKEKKLEAHAKLDALVKKAINGEDRTMTHQEQRISVECDKEFLYYHQKQINIEIKLSKYKEAKAFYLEEQSKKEQRLRVVRLKNMKKN